MKRPLENVMHTKATKSVILFVFYECTSALNAYKFEAFKEENLYKIISFNKMAQIRR